MRHNHTGPDAFVRHVRAAEFCDDLWIVTIESLLREPRCYPPSSESLGRRQDLRLALRLVMIAAHDVVYGFYTFGYG
jgi:hypothetical protein